MTWPNTIPAYIEALRNQFQACDTWQKEGGSLERIHYPTCNVSGERGDLDPVPAILIAEAPLERRQYAPGVPGVPGGTFKVIIYLDAARYPTAAEAEHKVDEILYELAFQDSGHDFGNIDRGDASDPTPAARAAADGTTTAFRSITVMLPWGMTP